MKKYVLIMGIAFVLSFAVSACGSDGPTTNLNVDMTEFMFNPSNYTVPAGQEITLELSNEGAVEHEFVIMEQGAEVGDDFGEEDEANIYWEAELAPGASGTYTFTAPGEPGEYQVVCGTPGHYLAGMVGKLIIVPE